MPQSRPARGSLSAAAVAKRPLNVVVNYKTGLSAPALTEGVVWPDGWPLPRVGDAVVLQKVHGFVTHVTFDLDSGKLIVNTR